MESIREQFDETGFVLVEGGIPAALLSELREGLAPLIGARDAGRTSSPTRHQTILQPDQVHPSFVKFLNLESINRVAETVIGTDELAFAGLAVLLGCSSYALCKWHRDHPDSNPDVQALLARPNVVLQLNCAVYDDASLWVVPGSHKRKTLAEERAWAARLESLKFVGPFADATAIEPDVLTGMPGAMHAKLNAGDCLIYNPLLWHAAEYRPEWKRATLHGGWRRAALIDEFDILRWGLTHNPWLLEPSYLGDLGPYFGPQLERYQTAVRRHAPELVSA